MSFLTLNNVSKNYGAVTVVRGVTLSVAQGEFVSLLGPSGCGKTTTLQMIAGFADVSSGQITLGGRDITHAKPNSRGLGIVFQSYALFPHMTVAQNVSFGLEMRQVAKVERADRVAAALALVHLDAHADRYPRQLSGGQRQRVALARALVIQPAVLLLDEPLSNLDAKLREEMQFELRQIQRKVGTTTIMVTHDQTEALSISDRVVVMEAGQITQIDRPYQVYEHPRTRFISTFVGKANLLPGRVRGPAAAGGGTIIDVGIDPRVERGTGVDPRVDRGTGRGGVAVEIAGSGYRAGDSVTLSLRPEKLRFVAPGQGQIDGVIQERFFLGSQWLYRVASSIGELALACPNDGHAPQDEQATVGIAWSPDMVRALEGDAA